MIYPEIANFTMVGINHWEAPVEIREKFSLSENQQLALINGARREGFGSLFAISTCNRTELVSLGATSNELVRLLTTYSNGTLEEFHNFGFELEGERAVRHLFKVATGLDSQILGDLQIVKQVKEWCVMARRQVMLSGVLYRLMENALRARRRSRGETSLGKGAATEAYAAVRSATQYFERLADKNMLHVG